MNRVLKNINYIFNKWVDGEIGAPLHYSLFLPLYILSMFYGIGVNLRLFLYHIGIFKIKRLDCKVISIGNITMGGSGKTPMAIYLAEKFKARGKKVVILSRGYKGKIKDIGIVSDGENILLGPDEAGDEPYLMAVKLETVPVIAAKNRYKAGRYAIEKFHADIIILDDGFQHIKLHRDIDLLLVDSMRGFSNGHLFPLGALRESITGLNRASLVMIKGGLSSVNPAIAKFGHQLPAIRFLSNSPVIFFSYRSQGIINLADNTKLTIDILKGKKVAALSGIADPKSFKNTLDNLGALVQKEVVFPDHYSYTHNDIQTIIKETSGIDMIITTMKDAVKLKYFSIEHLPIYALEIGVEIENLEIFEKTIGFQ